MSFDFLEFLNDETLNEQGKINVFRKHIEENCFKDDSVLAIFRSLKSIEMGLMAFLDDDSMQTGVNKSTVEKLLRIIHVEIRIIRYKIKHPELIEERLSGNFPIGQWTDNKADLIELIYAISLVHSVEHGKVSIKAIKEGFEYIFRIDLGNIHDRLDDIACRNEPKVRYLEKLSDSMNKYLYSLDAR